MFLPNSLTSLSRLLKNNAKPRRPKPVLRFETLEDRTVPATVLVTPTHLAGWDITTSGTAVVDFENGPATPPLGTGSLEFNLTSGTDTATVCNDNVSGVLISDLTNLRYSTFVTSASTNQTPYLVLNVDLDGNGSTDDRLFFEPNLQTSQTVQLGIWQSWSALGGLWWSEDGTGSATQASPKSLSTILAAYGSATATVSDDGICVAAGDISTSGWTSTDFANFDANVDRVVIAYASSTTTSSTVYNFEAPPRVVYVNDSWAGKVDGSDPDGSGPATVFGVNAFTTIQEAIDAVADGGIVRVEEGIYAGGINVDKSVTISFLNTAERGHAVVTGGDLTVATNNLQGFGAFAINASDVTIKSLTLRGSGSATDSNYGIYIVGANSSIQILSNAISGFVRAGITTEFAGGSSNNLIERNIITMVGTSGVGVYLQSGANNVLDCNTIIGGHANVTLDSETNATLRGNTLTGGDIGIELFESEAPLVFPLIGTQINFNNITNHETAGLQLNAPQAIDAENNYWGSNHGPTIFSNPNGTGDTIEINGSGTVDYGPWLAQVFSESLLVYTADGITVTIKPGTGRFAIVTDDGLVSKGSGAQFLPNGRFQIHTRDTVGRKVDLSGFTMGTVTLRIRNSSIDRSFTLEFEETDFC